MGIRRYDGGLSLVWATAALALAVGLVSREAFATPAAEPVEIEFLTPGEFELYATASDIDYVQIEQHLFKAQDFAEISSSDVIYVVADDLYDQAADDPQLPFTETSILVTVPYSITLAGGAYCERVDVTVVSAETTQVLNRKNCFAVDSTGKPFAATSDELANLVEPLIVGVDKEGAEVIEVAGTGLPFDKTNPLPTETVFATLVVDLVGVGVENSDGGAK